MSATVQFLTNEKGRKTAVVLPIEDYEKLQEDLEDLAVIAERRDEETIPHAEFKKGLKRNGLSR
jgi:PHD/YefM family antitoxin component YafN of YafNO toxin-antitoxin module